MELIAFSNFTLFSWKKSVNLYIYQNIFFCSDFLFQFFIQKILEVLKVISCKRECVYSNINSNLYYTGTRGNTPRCVTSSEPCVRDFASGQHCYELRRNVAALANRWRRSVRFARRGINPNLLPGAQPGFCNGGGAVSGIWGLSLQPLKNFVFFT